MIYIFFVKMKNSQTLNTAIRGGPSSVFLILIGLMELNIGK